MNSKQFSQDNHYVPQVYLKQWASHDGRIWSYRVLVSDSRVPTWKLSSTKGIAYRTHLYTRVNAAGQTDEMEQWFDREFEAPAELAIGKIVSGGRLSPDDWKILIRFLAAQDVRTPSRLSESLERWDSTLPYLIQTTLDNAVNELEAAQKENQPIRKRHSPHTEFIPMRIRTESGNQSGTATIKVESVSGRGLWLYSLKHLLTKTINILLGYKWMILKPPKDINWITSDDPVIKLNYFNSEKYDFKGGWGSAGTEILFPITPNHLMYTKIGEKPPLKGTIVSEEVAQMFQRFTAEHANRFIFAVKIDPQAQNFRPRVVDQSLFDEEEEQWKKWHDKNTLAERQLYE